MPDLLTHVLVGYAIGTFLARRADWIGPPYVTLAMLGATLPDANRIDVLLPAHRLERPATALAGELRRGPLTAVVPARVTPNWEALHTVPASLLLAGIAALLVPARYRRRAFALLVLGALSHHALDLLLVDPGGRAFPLFWPLTRYEPPTPGLFSSRDLWLVPVGAVVAALSRVAADRA